MGLKQMRSGGERIRMEPLNGKRHCGKCGFRIRGPEHNQGIHHMSGGRRVNDKGIHILVGPFKS